MHRKLYLFAALALLLASCDYAKKSEPAKEPPQEDQYADQEYDTHSSEYVEWTGPGWYYGVWFRTSDEYGDWKRRHPRGHHSRGQGQGYHRHHGGRHHR